MAWIKLTDSAPSARPGTVLVSLSRSPSASVPSMRVRIGRLPATKAGLSEGRTVELLWGIGEDAGYCLIRTSKAGPRIRAQHATGALDVQFGFLPQAPLVGRDGSEWTFATERQPGVECGWGVVEGGLAIRLPAAWWAVSGDAPAAPEAAPADLVPTDVAPEEASAKPHAKPSKRPVEARSAPEVAPSAELSHAEVLAEARAVLGTPAPDAGAATLVAPAKMDAAIKLLLKGHKDGFVANALRLTPQQLATCKAERQRRESAGGDEPPLESAA